MAAAETLSATVVYAMPERQLVLPVLVPAGSTLRDAVVASGLLTQEPSLDAGRLDLGVFNRPRPADTLLRAGDRVEVYRPLTIDPKEARRVRAEVRRRRAG
jgi:putative ubiquitin-RnfH superfamily antitoxin RatB of RatAB toxin-antitoxin module